MLLLCYNLIGDNMKVITICGSMKFINTMIEIGEKLELEGNCVLLPFYNLNRASKDSYTEEEGKMLDLAHKERIKLADEIVIIDVNEYIGESTKKEIEFATLLNKEITYYSKMN